MALLKIEHMQILFYGLLLQGGEERRMWADLWRGLT
jgi:hypothetical protein